MDNSNKPDFLKETSDQVTRENLEIKAVQQKITLRDKFSNYAFWFVFGWLIFLGLILIACAWTWPHKYITPFSDNVLIALIGGCSANIIGLFAIVLRHLFPGRE